MSSPSGPSQTQAVTSPANFESMLFEALTEFEKKTGKELQAIWLASEMKTCQHVDSVLEIVRYHANTFERSDDQAPMKWIDPLVHVLYTFSDALDDVVSLVRIMNVPIRRGFDITCEGVPSCKSNPYGNRCPTRCLCSHLVDLPHLTLGYYRRRRMPEQATVLLSTSLSASRAFSSALRLIIRSR